MIKINRSTEAAEVFSEEGLIGKSLPGFELRPQQVKMALAVQKALLGGRKLAVEAGTGVGKSFAYLVPAIDIVTRTGRKLLVSTFTITLQEQLINKDLPFLADCLNARFTAVLAKGRANYLCKRRLEFALRRQQGLYDSFGTDLAAIKTWAASTSDGSLSDLSFVPKSLLWDSVCSEHGNCRGRKCGHFRDCFYWRARRRLETADIIVANHALMFSDLVLKDQGVSLLPDYDYVIVDEAHNIEHVAEGHFGINISFARINYLLSGLYSPRSKRGTRRRLTFRSLRSTFVKLYSHRRPRRHLRFPLSPSHCNWRKSTRTTPKTVHPPQSRPRRPGRCRKLSPPRLCRYILKRTKRSATNWMACLPFRKKTLQRRRLSPRPLAMISWNSSR